MYERTYSGALGPYFAQIRQIGAGGNGRILSAIDTRFDFPVCIKRISVANKDECRAALREIRIRRRLRHENIVGLLNAIVSDGTDVSEITPANFRDTTCIYLVQELLDADLHQVIESNARLTDEYVKLFFYQLLRGLKYIHSANVLHRDLKPSNIMINLNSLLLMIGDFGQSMVLDPEYNHGNSLTSSATSLWYKAPELILGSSQHSTASDVWSAGCILAEMLLGRPLFEGENDLEQLEMIIHAINVDQTDQVYVREYLPDTANTMYSGKPKFPLRTKFQKVDCQALHLLERLLSFNPNERVTTEMALSHPFLEDYACVADEPVCLKALHLEHEVDDFLEYTLKDLVVGECVALAEEQPRIHLQMSSYCSLTDLPKECNDSPCESSSQSVDENRIGLELKTVSEDYQEGSNDSEASRFKVLEVLKEEHGSSSDSNGLAVHEEGVSEEPLVLDHPMFSTSKLEERHNSHKPMHRRHHSHHRRKQTDEAKARRRKEKWQLRSPCGEYEPNLDFNHRRSLPEIHAPGEDHLPRVNSPGEEVTMTPKVEKHSGNSEAQSDDKVQELIMRSRQLIADQTTVVDGLPAITDVCGCVSPKEIQEVPMETQEDVTSKVDRKFISSSVDDLRKLSHYGSASDLGVAEVIRRSQELIGQLYTEKKSLLTGDVSKDLATRSEQLETSSEVRELAPNDNSSERELSVLNEKGSLFSDDGSEELIRSSGQAVIENTMDGSAPVKDLITRSEQLLKSSHIKEQLQPQGDPGLSNIPELPLADKSYNYPPPFTESFEDLELKQPRVCQPLLENTLTKDKVDIPSVASLNYPLPITDTTPISLQPMLSDPYHLKESNRRMQELFQESHTLLESIEADQSVGLGTESALNVRDPGDASFHNDEQSRELIEKKSFHQSLDRIDVNEMKLVLDQAKKLLGKSKALSEDNEMKDTSNTLNEMEIDLEDSVVVGRVKSDFCQTPGLQQDESFVSVEEKCTSPKDDLKVVLCFQHQLDFVRTVSEPSSHQAAISEVFEMKLSPPFEEQVLRLNSFRRTTKGKDGTCSCNNDDTNFKDFRTDERNEDFHYEKQALVKKRSNDMLSQTPDDNTHKHFKNSRGTSPCDILSTAIYESVEESKNQESCTGQEKEHFKNDNNDVFLNGVKTSETLNVDSDIKRVSKVCQIKSDPEKYTEQYHPIDSTLRNGDAFTDRVIEELASDDVVDKLYGTTCRMENNAKRLNSKDSAGLQTYYATLKIRNIIRNHARNHRDKRHDTYPF